MISKKAYYIVVNFKDEIKFVDGNGHLHDTFHERFYIESEQSANIRAKQLSRKGYKFFVKHDTLPHDPF